MSRWFVLAIVVVIVLVATWALRRAGGEKAVALAAGDEVFAIEPSAITELRYTTTKTEVIAKREGDSDTFGIRVHTTDPPGDQSCRSAGTFRRLLEEFTTVRVKGSLSPKDREEARSLSDRAARLELRDNTPIDPKEFRVVMVGTPERPVFLDGPLAYEPTISVESLKRLSGGCTSLSGD